MYYTYILRVHFWPKHVYVYPVYLLLYEPHPSNVRNQSKYSKVYGKAEVWMLLNLPSDMNRALKPTCIARARPWLHVGRHSNRRPKFLWGAQVWPSPELCFATLGIKLMMPAWARRWHGGAQYKYVTLTKKARACERRRGTRNRSTRTPRKMSRTRRAKWGLYWMTDCPSQTADYECSTICPCQSGISLKIDQCTLFTIGEPLAGFKDRQWLQ